MVPPGNFKMLNAPLMLEELSLAAAKIASTDGLPAEVYKGYGEFLLNF